jgi:hypothetical protein
MASNYAAHIPLKELGQACSVPGPANELDVYYALYAAAVATPFWIEGAYAGTLSAP